MKTIVIMKTLQTNYFALENNFLISQIGYIFWPLKHPKYVSLAKQVDW